VRFSVTILCTPTARDLTFNVDAPGLADARIKALRNIIKEKHYVIVSVKRATTTNV